ncbi:MAG: hypothetical protein PHX30_03695 [Candidatus Pacebacteria bacterium]|nr:hypothetical protein [Candidatus Paceibacterota bacterium]
MIGEENGENIFAISLENGIGYQWPESFLLEHGLTGIFPGSIVEICGKEGNSKIDLWGAKLKDVRMFKGKDKYLQAF